MDANQADMVAQFSAVTGANPSTAQAALSSANWNLEQAVTLYYAASEDPQHDHDADYDDEDTPDATAPQPSAPRQPQQSASSGSNTNRQRLPGSGPRAMTLRDLQRGDDDEDEDDKDQDLYAGGEKSGLAVENPDSRGGNQGPVDHFRNIMNQARANRDRPGGDEEPQPQRSSHFTGRAQTLGGDDAPSQVIEDPRANVPSARQPLPRVTRTMHLWADGVSIDDGPLFRFDDPANQDMMTQINQGRAPLSLLDVQPDQEVDLNLMPHKEENYVQPKKTYKPFSGQGQRLGAPTPGPAPSSSTATTTAAQPASAASTSAQKPAQMDVDESQPTLQLQIRLGDGTRLQSRFNTSHTVGDVYTFVNRASAASTQRPYALMTTFPSKELEEKAQVLGDMADFKRGGVVVQKWK